MLMIYLRLINVIPWSLEVDYITSHCVFEVWTINTVHGGEGFIGDVVGLIPVLLGDEHSVGESGDLRFVFLRLSTIKKCPHMLRSDHRELRYS